MDIIDLPEDVGSWKKEKVLGAGSFGYVVLWRNKETSETIALKQCRWGHDSGMTPKNRSRWKLEVDMMSRLDHANVVKAIPVPSELDVPATELPLLAMEYCSSGDLRKLLNKPENCCGLKEKLVRLLLRHVSCAVNYLHSMRIIHRDLKPENIVIQDVSGTVIYKLIDLGYAKELDQGSLCTSFVGTLQYLAPELFMAQKYSCTVDYWSLGLVTHEVITGIRPFLPDKSPAEWIPIIKQKMSSQIRAYLDSDKNIIFSSEISPHHHICSIFKQDIEKWLQSMLEWDPKKRGRSENGTAFGLLENILDKKVVHVFCVNTCELLNFTVDENLSLEGLKKQVELKSGIPIFQQEIILPKGHSPSHGRGTSQFFLDLEEEAVIFLFNKHFSEQNISPACTVIPPVVETMMRNPCLKVCYQDQRDTWAQAVHVSHQECTLFHHLIQAFRANLMNLLTKTSYTHKSTARMTAEMNKLTAKCSFFKSSLEQDLTSYEKQVQNGGFILQHMEDRWKNSLENLKKIDILKQKVTSLEELSTSISTRTVELQRTSYARSKQTNPLDETHNKVLELYADLRRRPKEQRHISHDNTDIVQLLCICLQQRFTLLQDVMSQISNTFRIKKDIDDVLPQIENLLKEILEWDCQVDIWQAKRQRELWAVIDALSDKVRQAERSSSPVILPGSPQTVLLPRPTFALGRTNFPRYTHDAGLHNIPESSSFSMSSSKNITPPVIPVPQWQSRLEPLVSSTNSPHVTENFCDRIRRNSSPLSMGSMPLSSLLDKTTEDSRRITKENENLVESFLHVMDVLKSCQENETIEANGHELPNPNINRI